MCKIEGYVIIAPPAITSGEYRPHLYTFSRSTSGAWRTYIGATDNLDISTYIQRWHDRGYRVKRAIMEIMEDE